MRNWRQFSLTKKILRYQWKKKAISSYETRLSDYGEDVTQRVWVLKIGDDGTPAGPATSFAVDEVEE